MLTGRPWTGFVGCVLLAGAFATSSVRAHPDLERQIADVTTRLELAPRDAELYLHRAELYRVHRDWPAAEADYARARRLQPRLAIVDFYLGRMKLEADRPKEAKKALDRFLSREPDHARARIARARALVKLGDPLAAVADYTRALAGFDEDQRPEPEVYLERARALAALGDAHADAALRGLDEGLARLGQPVTLQLYAIEIEVERGRHDAALERLQAIADSAERQESWLVRRAEILEGAGRVGEARDAYASALAAVAALPPNRRGNRAMRRLEQQARAALERLDAGSPN